MKKPDEIKKGLRDGPEYHVHRGEACLAYTKLINFRQKLQDALDYIQQLEAANAELLNLCKQLEENCHQLERERDAAVADMVYIANRGWDVCGRCKHDPGHGAKCKSLDETKDCFEWRGVKEE